MSAGARRGIARLLPAAWSPECWTPRYAADRIRTAWYHHRHPELPWLTRAANERLLALTGPQDTVLEFGSGRSTLFFARRCARVESVEHNAEWWKKVTAMLEAEGLAGKARVQLALHPESSYAEAARGFADATFTVVLVDGIRRADCVEEALPKLKPGGWLVLDNINRHIPNTCRGPGSVRAWDMSDPEHRKWKLFADATSAWPREWTTNGVSDTLLLMKPRG